MISDEFFEETLSSDVIYNGRRITLKYDRVKLSNGNVSTREIVDHPEAVAVLPMLSKGIIGLVKQYRYALEKVSIEIPAGCIEKGEDPLEAAKRELKEETGYIAKDWHYFTSVYLAPGFCNEKMHIYFARDIQKGEQSLDDDEIVKIEEVSFNTAVEWVQNKIIDDGKTALSIMMALAMDMNE